MKIIRFIRKVKNNPYEIVRVMITQIGFINKLLPDDIYLKGVYRGIMKVKLKLDNPQTFNEKLQWLKLNDRNPEYTRMVDKYDVKSYVADKIGEKYIIPTYNVWDTFDEIEFNDLPNQFVLKCTHDSGGYVIVHDKNMNMDKVREKLEKSLKKNFFYWGREWPYKDVKPRIIAEKYMENSSGEDLVDYKLMCFNGEPKCIFVCENRSSKENFTITVYDMDWNIMPFEREYPRREQPGVKPSTYEEMIELAKKLSENIPFVRVDFYEIKGKLYFGELTFYPGAGFGKFNPPEWDKKLGDWLVLPDKKT